MKTTASITHSFYLNIGMRDPRIRDIKLPAVVVPEGQLREGGVEETCHGETENGREEIDGGQLHFICNGRSSYIRGDYKPGPGVVKIVD